MYRKLIKRVFNSKKSFGLTRMKRTVKKRKEENQKKWERERNENERK